MLSVFICEDDPMFRKKIESCVNSYIFDKDAAMKNICTTSNPHDVLDCLQSNEKIAGLYFLDLDLGCEIDGAKLALEIRKHDPRGFIVFVTSDGESQLSLLKYRIEMMDYIVKSHTDFEERIHGCLESAYQRFMSTPTLLHDKFSVKLYQNGGSSKNTHATVASADIVYFETSTDFKHVLRLYTTDSYMEFRDSISGVMKKVDNKMFFKCGRNVIINLFRVAEVDIGMNY